jgi:hypothetical protein
VIPDDDIPVIDLGTQPTDVTLGLDATSPDLAFGITCTDTNPVDNPGGSGVPVDITANLDFSPTTINTNVEGVTGVTYTCVDAAGNPADPVVRTFTVVAGQAFEIQSMTISDINGDGLAGCFRFSDIDPTTCTGANRFSSDGSAVSLPDPTAATLPGTGTDLENGMPVGIRFGTFQGAGLISPGFNYTGFPFVPFTFDPPTEPATEPKGYVVTSGNTAFIQLDSFPWGGQWTSSKVNNFFLDPDANTFQGNILEIEPVVVGSGVRTFKYRMSWSHVITAAEDETDAGEFTNFKARWVIEGVITTDEASTVLNDPPVINTVTASQGSMGITRIVVSDNGLVTITANAQDPNGDNLSYSWVSPVVPVNGTSSSTLQFDPQGIPNGLLTFNLTVTDDATDPLSASATLILNLVSDPADPDYGDDDNDGIPNYLDAVTNDPTRNLRDPSGPATNMVMTSAGRLVLGDTAFSTGLSSFVVTEDDIGVPDVVNSVKGIGHTGGGIYDFQVADLTVGAAVDIVLPQTVAMPNLSIYRKYTGQKGWFDFSSTAGNALASAMRLADGSCPAPGSAAYTAGFTAGYECVRLTVADGSDMDGDGARNGVVVDPGTVSNNGPASAGDDAGGGCSISTGEQQSASAVKHAEWWLLALFAAGYSFYRRKSGRLS